MNKLYEYLGPERNRVLIKEAVTESGERSFYMEGVFIQADVRNHNQRVYPLDEISNAVSEIQRKIKTGESILGELDHPDELTINLDRVSHVISDMWMNGSDGYGKLKIIESTPCGKIAHGLLSSGIKLGVSSRGSGNVNHDGTVSEFDMVTVDIVAQPSAPEAYPKSIYESLYNMRGGSMIYEQARDAAHGDKLANKHMKKSILDVIKELKI